MATRSPRRPSTARAAAQISAAEIRDQAIRARLSACATSAYIESGYLIAVGGLVFFKPHFAFEVFEKITLSGPLTPIGSETLYFRLFGAFGMGYVGLWYGVAAYNKYTAFFKVSVVTRCVLLPIFHLALVYSGATGAAWLEAAIPVDFLLGLHMLWNLVRNRGGKAAPKAE